MAHSFTRSKSTYKPQPRVLVLCEDTKSCKNYLEDAARHFRAYAEIEIAHCGKTDPLGIVSAAARRMQKFDHVYCAIDRDQHNGFDEAVALARQHKEKLTLITSYPCYEFWILLHFEYSRRPYVASGGSSPGECMVQDICKLKGLEKYSKGGGAPLFEMLLPRLSDARRNAMRVMNSAMAEGELNPSTKLHDLIEVFERLGAPMSVVKQ